MYRVPSIQMTFHSLAIRDLVSLAISCVFILASLLSNYHSVHVSRKLLRSILHQLEAHWKSLEFFMLGSEVFVRNSNPAIRIKRKIVALHFSRQNSIAFALYSIHIRCAARFHNSLNIHYENFSPIRH